jgi:chorismate-pyruvate lyase
MSIAATAAGPAVGQLFGHFPDVTDQPPFSLVAADAVPEPYRALLVHPHHMTVTVEAHYQDRVQVRVLASVQQGHDYARKILLTLANTGQVVQFGLVRIDLSVCPPTVAAQIVAGQTPLGRILIEHDVLRQIVPTSFLRLAAEHVPEAWFGPTTAETYGRLGYIYCESRPAIELLEILAPLANG